MHKLGYYLGHILFGLITLQLLKQGQSNYFIAAGLLIIIAHSFIIFNYLNDHFLFVIYLFSLCTMFSSDTFGGITLAPLLIFINYIRVPGIFNVKDHFVRFCIMVLVIANFSGYLIKNPTGLKEIIQSAIIFSGFIITFIFIQNYEFRKFHFSIILKVFTAISFLAFVVALNQKFVFIDSSLPLLGAVRYPTVSSIASATNNRIPSLICDYELFAELSLLMLIIAFSIIIDKRAIEYFKLRNSPYFLLIISFLNILITETRSCFLLSLLFILVFSFFRFREFFSKAAGRLVIIVVIMLPLLLLYGEKVGLESIINRIKEIDINNVSLKNLKSGEEMNRSYVYAAGYARLAEDNWLLGFGFSREAGNRWAWHGSSIYALQNYEDFHSLYLCIPMIYGWIGGVAYLLLIIYIILSLIRKFILYQDHPISGIALGFAFMFVFFLIDQLKINSLRHYYYHYLIWILMGFALSIINIKPSTDEDTLVN